MYNYNENKDYYDSIRGQTDEFRSSLRIDINRQLKMEGEAGNNEKAEALLHAIETNTPFMLYEDQYRNAVVVPKLKLVVQMFPDNKFTVYLHDEIKFQNAIKYLYIVYPHFCPAPIPIVKHALTMAISKLQLSIPN